MSKTLVLIRHAHRDTDEQTRDNGLSVKGQEQVKKLMKFVEERWKGQEAVFLTSPKKRCIETLTPIAQEFKKKCDVNDYLDEQGSSETTTLYLARIDEFLNSWKYDGAELTVICSHGDLIPVVIEKLTSAKTGLKKAGYGEIEYFSGESHLTWLVQKV